MCCRCLERDPRLRPTIAGPDGLLSHPFLQCTGRSRDNGTEGGEPPETIHRAVEATLRVIESQPEVMKLSGRQRMGAVYKVGR